MIANEALQKKTDCKQISFLVFMSAFETISAKVLNILYSARKLFKSKCLMFYIWHGNSFS